jgi:2-polyprenyl-6-methoxyphenol hydroxylase-like FAD-dependent oxidoreductase
VAAHRRALIAGGGLGGLTAALALHRKGWNVCVFEQAPTLEPVGAGISLWPNSLRALDAIGIGAKVRAAAVALGPGGIRRPDGEWLTRTDVGAAIEARFGDPVLLLHRAELADLIVRELPFGVVQAATRVLGVHIGSDATAATLITEHGESDAELVVAADGIRSVLRGFMYPQNPGPAYAGYTAWRMVIEAAAVGGPVPGGFETFGPGGHRFAVLPLDEQRLYCYATATGPALSDSTGAAPASSMVKEMASLRGIFGDWHEPIPQILAALTPAQLLHQDVEELSVPLPAFDRGRLALIGDAAHAMTPDLGQGGGMAIEDAVVLAHVLADPDTPVIAALGEYTRQRLARTTQVARRSRRAGRITTVPYPAQVLTAKVADHLPGKAIPRALAAIVDWHPPGEAPPPSPSGPAPRPPG